MSNLSDTSPTQQTPLFSAQFVTCAYPISDLYASSPRYLFYALLVAVFVTQWHGWLANVFLGAAATYAGTAAIEAFILITNKAYIPPTQNITIPYISDSDVNNSTTLSGLANLLTETSWLPVTPAALELDVDAILAITVTAYLTMLPMHCWSSVVRGSRVRHLLMGIWNLLMLVGTACALVLWDKLNDVPIQFRFCYPQYPDTDSVTSDSSILPDGVWKGNWNSTIWQTFQSSTLSFILPDNCLYPCFNTSQILRRSNSLVASVSSSTRSPRTNYNLTETELDRQTRLMNLMYTAIIVSGVVAIFLLVFTLIPQFRRLTRVPIHRPKELLWEARKELAHALWTESILGTRVISHTMLHPQKALHLFSQTSSNKLWRHSLHTLRFFSDIFALVLLLFAMILIPATIVIFIVFIEWYIHRDIVSNEAPSQVGQWTTSVSIALVLLSAALLRLKYRLASRREIETEIDETQNHLEKLEKLIAVKREKQRRREEQRAQKEGQEKSQAGMQDSDERKTRLKSPTGENQA